MTHTQQPEALNLEEFRAKVTHAAREPLLARIAELEAQLSAIGAGGVEPLRKQAAQAAVQQGWKLVPVEPTERMLREGGCTQTLKHGHQYIGRCAAKTAWSSMLAAAPQPPETTPVELPEPVGWFHRHPKECKNGEACNYQIAPADRKYGWEEFPLYTEQQVHALLTGVPTPAAYADTKDAARYRWLRDNDWRNDEKMEPVIRLQLNAIWDEKIDAAMEAQARKEKGTK